MEILVGPAFSIEVSSPSSKGKQQPSSVFLNEKDEESPVLSRVGSDVSSDTSSSIGAPDDSDSEDDETNSDAVSSKSGAFGSLDSLEDSLPIKRGLSNYFNGKSKSFMNLSEVNLVSEVKELEKPENPFNKRRRILMANKCSTRKNKKSTFYTWSNPKSMPLLPLNEEDDDQEHSQLNSSSEKLEEQDADSSSGSSSGKLEERKLKASLKYYQSCFDLHELQEHEEEYQ